MTGPAHDIVVDTLRLRGPHGRRLARVAARALPAALGRALSDLDGVAVDSVRVVLDLDPEEYDDETLAVLWADLVRAELVARRDGTAAAASPPADRTEPGTTTTTRGPTDPVAAARAWSSLPAEAREAVPAALLSLGDPELAVHAAARLGPAGWRRLVASLRLVLPVDAATRGVSAPHAREESGRAAPAGEGRSSAASAEAAAVPAAAAGRGAGGSVPLSAARELVAEAADVVAVLETLGELQAGAPTPLHPDAVTRAAGLVLLYPWLADHCRAAEALHPGLDQHDVREAALAALLGDRATSDDPLVRMLGGRPEPWDLPPRDRVELPHQAEVEQSAERVLASFASLLPGFERSTPEFVRAMWLVRLGVLDTGRHPALLVAATHPLDVLLPLLPYPVGLFRLPWSPPLTVTFRP